MQISLADIQQTFVKHGVSHIVAKPLAENDNTKQQIYFGKGFDALTLLPFSAVRADATATRPNFKARVEFFWLAPSGHFVNAPFAQLILYPDYPEVRFSGFLRGCPSAPSSEMQPVPLELRGAAGAWDGRVLFMGVTGAGHVLGVLASKGSVASGDFQRLAASGHFQNVGVLYTAPLSITAQADTRTQLLAALREVHHRGWIPSQRLHSDGVSRPYRAVNGGGYTLESLLAIQPNGRSQPDYLGWEIKAYSQNRITLMTPEPDGGVYGSQGVEAFLRKYGRWLDNETIYFTGIHRVGARQSTTGHLLSLEGYDPVKRKIVDVNGGITLVDTANEASAIWSYPDLIDHWGRKHANAAYVPYTKQATPDIAFRYQSPVLLGVGTDFSNYLHAMYEGKLVYDPASKLTISATGSSKTKARNQFRMSVAHLPCLYDTFEPVIL